jgi:hypothetical protein
VALDNCTYDAKTAEPVEGVIIDADADLVELCTRIKQGERQHCAILFCEEEEQVLPSSSRPSSHVKTPTYPPTTH